MSSSTKKSIFAVTFWILFVSFIIGMLHFAYTERKYVREIAVNQKVIIDGINILNARLVQVESFAATEFPSQVKDFMEKQPK